MLAPNPSQHLKSQPVSQRNPSRIPSIRETRPGWRAALFCFVREPCLIASGLGTIGEPIIEISQAHNYRGGIIVFQFFRRHAHLCGALPKMV